jgi:hypothetical protein
MSDRQQQAVNAPGREPEEVKAERPAGRAPEASDPTPLFLRDGSDGAKGNAQDEKDEAAE